MSAKQKSPKNYGISKIWVSGYKSIRDSQFIDVAPLTVLAGANSSGKSSIMQPLLLLKQTLEASYDPGALLLDGPNLKFTSSDQLLSRPSKGRATNFFRVGFSVREGYAIETDFAKEPSKGFKVERTSYSSQGKQFDIKSNSRHADLMGILNGNERSLFNGYDAVPIRVRCFLKCALKHKGEEDERFFLYFSPFPGQRANLDFEQYLTQIIHLPGLRGNPQRTYPVSAVGSNFVGTFERYSASVIAQWQADKEKETLDQLFSDLKLLELTWKVTAKPINETQVELHVGRLPRPARGGSKDWVSIADVGFGVSQTLPVLVALHAAQPGQLVYVEQPEIHLHPRAQSAMARVLANAALRGIRVVVETHSSLLLLGIQTLIAEGVLPPDDVKLHWFRRSKEDGATSIDTAVLDKGGTFGDWPQDFADVALEAQSRYLDAAELPDGAHAQ